MGIPLRVLIVEDSEDDALLVVRELQRGGYDVTFERIETAEAMSAALDNWQWDIVLADYTMPHFSGTDALKLLRNKDLDMPFIFVSGTIGEDRAVAAMRSGAHDYILKGSLKRLVPAIERELREAEVRRERRRAETKIAQEMKIISHLLMIAEATAHTTNVDKLMQQAAHCGRKIMYCDICLSYLYDKEIKTFRPSQQYGLPHEQIPLFMTEPLDEKAEFVKKAVEGKEPVIIQFEPPHPLPQGEREHDTSPPLTGGETEEGESLFPWLPDIKTIALIPLIGKTEYLGLIIGIYKTSKVFTERDKKLMQGISHQVSTALEQARLFRESIDKAMELSHKIETIQVMNEIDRSILSTLEANEILETVARLVSRVISCERVSVVLVDKEKKGFIYKAGFGTIFASKEIFTPFEDTNTTEVIKTNRLQYIANLNDIKDPLPLERELLKEGFLAHIRVPLVIKEEITGVLSIGSKRPSTFTKQDLTTIEKIASQIGVALSNAKLISDLEELFVSTVKVLSNSIDAKSPWTRGHSERVTNLALETGKKMGLNAKELKTLELAGILHDIGKLGTYEAILDKPGKLTDDELKLMKQHPAKGAEMLEPIKQLKDIIPAIKYHHECYDGTGYPEGLKGRAIPIYARILSVADTVDAMGADRPYRNGRPMDVIIAELKRCSGTQFDSSVVEVFLRTVEQ